MFEKLSDRLSDVFRKISGRNSISEGDLKEALRAVRLALLEADVNYKVVKDFLISVSDKALGADVLKSLSPGEQVINIVYQELTEMMGVEFQDLNFKGDPPWPIMLVGLQGSGKTTTAGKLALYLKKRTFRPLLVPADVARPAAIEQLTKLGADLDVPVFPSTTAMTPTDISKKSLVTAGQIGCNVIIIDTAGRLSIDQELMDELESIKSVTMSQEILLVADAMTGQEAVNIAANFNKKLSLTGVILTKMEGDARGGAAMSIRAITDTPIKFIGVGEKADALEPFHPDRMASLILGMGDVLSLIEKAKEHISEQEQLEQAQQLMKGRFTFDDFKKQLVTMSKIGGLQSIIGMIPGLGKLKQIKNADYDPKTLTSLTAMIDSMTLEERRNHAIINTSRRKRIANGSGNSITEVNQLMTVFEQMLKIIKQTSRAGGIDALKRQLLSGNLPGFPGGGAPQMGRGKGKGRGRRYF
ncbi:MAG: signal recognition particle protein [Deltaproteobacteria bacterium]|jgi:signal recognition particle subunit SRP54|nr:signal recognition particle protein [Deltaproteobacteria bacterium]